MPLILLLALFAQSAWCTLSGYPNLEEWLFFEQKRMETSVDRYKIVSPDLSALPDEYRPESGNYFLLPSLWVPDNEWQAFQSASLPVSVSQDIEKLEGDRRFYRLFVHPLSKTLYRPLIDKYGLHSDHLATPTSSARTLLVIPKESNEPYFAKTSLDVVLATTKRNIPAAEVIRSVGMSEYVSKRSSLHPSFDLIPDAFGIVPNDMSRAGQLIRPIPKEVLSNQSLPIPLFSLYSTDETGETLFEKWVTQTGLNPFEAARKLIIEPFSQAWTQWALSGLTHEAHAQNVLIEVDPKTKLPTSRFFLRDAGGLFLNPKAQAVSSQDLLSLPAPNGFFWDYQKWAATSENNSLNIYFVGGFLFNLEKEIKRLDPNYQTGNLEKEFYKEIGTGLSRHTGLSPGEFKESALKYHMADTLTLARETQTGTPTPTLGEKLNRPLRLGFYSGTFDPPHKGHLDLVQAAIQEKDLDMVIIAPNFRPAYKPDATAYSTRKKMTEMLFNRPRMTLVWDNFESASLSNGSDGVLREMLKTYDPDTRIYRILGNDSFDWFYQSEEGLTDPRIIYLVSQRDPSQGSVFPSSIRKSPVEVLAFRGEGFSSSAIKNQLVLGKKHPALPENVHSFVQSQGLYSCESLLKLISKVPAPR